MDKNVLVNEGTENAVVEAVEQTVGLGVGVKVAGILGLTAIVGGLTYIFVKRHKDKKAALEEDYDEEVSEVADVED